MATQTIQFACQEVPSTCPVRPIGGGAPVAAQSVSEVYEGLMQATYLNLVGDYTIHPLDAGGAALGVGTVYNVTNTDATFLETSLLEPCSGGSGGSGTGANTVTITVDDGTDPLENAKVRVTNGAESYLAETDVNGQVTFSLDDATWSVAITKPMYQFTPTTLAVSGVTAHTYSMTATSITPSDPGFVTGYLYCYDGPSDPQSGVTVAIRMLKAPDGDTGAAYYSGVRTDTSDANGLVEFTGLVPGGTYALKRGTEPFTSFVVPADATDPVELGSIIGAA